MWLCVKCKMRRAQARLSAAGQIALTNYLMQTVLGMMLTRVLYELRGERGTVFWMMVTVLAICGAQVAWSAQCLRPFRFGTAEWALPSGISARCSPRGDECRGCRMWVVTARTLTDRIGAQI